MDSNLKTNNLLMVCGGSDGRPEIGVSLDGKLWIFQGTSHWEEFKFNDLYNGYYSRCTFNVIECFDSGFIAAGLSKEGLPLVFRSLLGGIWEQTNLIGNSPMTGRVQALGKVNCIIHDDITKQIFLLCANGELVTLPDCPKCIRIKKVADIGIIGGQIDREYIHLLLENDEEIHVPIRDAVQYRISFWYAKKRLSEEGYLIDLRNNVRCKVEGLQENSLTINPDDLPDWLVEIPKMSFLVFFCSYGINADEAVRYARSQGFNNAYSIGGIKQLFHIE